MTLAAFRGRSTFADLGARAATGVKKIDLTAARGDVVYSAGYSVVYSLNARLSVALRGSFNAGTNI